MTEVIGAVGPFQIVWHLVLGLSIVIHAWQMFANKWLTYKVQGFSDNVAASWYVLKVLYGIRK